MKWLKFTTIFLSAGALTLLDTSFFANMTIRDSSLVSVFQFIIILALVADTRNFFIFISGAIIFFAVFSSLPVWLIFILLFALPSAILYLRKGHLPLPSLPVAAIIILLANLIFELILLLYIKEWNKNGFLVMYYFILINTFFGALIYYFFHLYLNIKTRGGKIKNF